MILWRGCYKNIREDIEMNRRNVLVSVSTGALAILLHRKDFKKKTLKDFIKDYEKIIKHEDIKIYTNEINNFCNTLEDAIRREGIKDNKKKYDQDNIYVYIKNFRDTYKTGVWFSKNDRGFTKEIKCVLENMKVTL